MMSTPTTAQRRFLVDTAGGLFSWDVRGDVVARCIARDWVRRVPHLPTTPPPGRNVSPRYEVTDAGIQALGDDAPVRRWRYSEAKRAFDREQMRTTIEPTTRLALFRQRVEALATRWADAAEGLRELLPEDVDENGPNDMEESETDGMAQIYEETAEALRELLGDEAAT